MKQPESVNVGKEENLVVFRKAYVVKPGQFDFSSLMPYCQKLVFMTDSYADDMVSLQEQLEESLQFFDPTVDILVPVGNATASAISGAIIQRKLLMSGRKNWDGYIIAAFYRGHYDFWRVYTDPVRSPEQILVSTK